MRKITADKVYTMHSEAITQGVVVLDDAGEVLEVGHRSKYDVTDLEILQGVLIPGFVNTHCHLHVEAHFHGRALKVCWCSRSREFNFS